MYSNLPNFHSIQFHTYKMISGDDCACDKQPTEYGWMIVNPSAGWFCLVVGSECHMPVWYLWYKSGIGAWSWSFNSDYVSNLVEFCCLVIGSWHTSDLGEVYEIWLAFVNALLVHAQWCACCTVAENVGFIWRSLELKWW